jgi:hypothetical protein
LKSWRRNVEFKRILERKREEMAKSPDFVAWCMRERVKHRLWAEFEVLSAKQNKTQHDIDNIRKLGKEINTITEHVADAGQTVSYDEVSDADLVAMALARDVSIEAMTPEQMRWAHEALIRSAAGEDVEIPDDEPVAEEVVYLPPPLVDQEPEPELEPEPAVITATVDPDFPDAVVCEQPVSLFDGAPVDETEEWVD